MHFKDLFELAYNRSAVRSRVSYSIFSECVEQFAMKSVIIGIDLSQALALMLELWRRRSVPFGYSQLSVSQFSLYERVQLRERRRDIEISFTLQSAKIFRQFCDSRDLMPYEAVAYLMYSYVDLADTYGSGRIAEIISYINTYPFSISR